MDQLGYSLDSKGVHTLGRRTMVDTVIETLSRPKKRTKPANQRLNNSLESEDEDDLQKFVDGIVDTEMQHDDFASCTLFRKVSRPYDTTGDSVGFVAPKCSTSNHAPTGHSHHSLEKRSFESSFDEERRSSNQGPNLLSEQAIATVSMLVGGSMVPLTLSKLAKLRARQAETNQTTQLLAQRQDKLSSLLSSTATMEQEALESLERLRQFNQQK